MCKQLILSLLVLLGLVASAQAQLPVIDVADVVQNTTTAIETTLTTIETTLIEADEILNLTNLNGVTVEGGIAQDMQLLGQLVNQAQGLSYDIGAIQAQVDALFGLATAPTTTSGLRLRLQQIRQLKYQVYSYAIQVQTLLRTALRTVDHLQALLGTLSHLVGNLAGHETHAQTTAVASKHLANLDVQIAAFHRAQAVDRLEEVMILESLRRINNHVYERND
jgi:conjugal transfer/entry exclusion protein